jgi:hypothetical protein
MLSNCSAAELCECAGSRGQIGFESHFLADPEELFFCLQQLEEFTQILESSHGYGQRFVSAKLLGVPRSRDPTAQARQSAHGE